MNHQEFPLARDQSRANNRAAGLSLVLAITLLVLLDARTAFCAEALKPRQVIEKPKQTVVDRTLHHANRIYVKFQDDSNVRLRGGQLTNPTARALVPADPLLARLTTSGALWQPQHTISEERLSELRRTGEQNTGTALPDLNTAFILLLPAGEAPGKVIDELNALEVVEVALPIPLPAPLPVVGNYEPQQGYLNPASATTNGINAKYAWTVAGGNGANVKIVDIEYDWNPNHGDVSAFLIGPMPVVPVAQATNAPDNHGTAVLGIMGGFSDGVGVTGIAWGSTLYKAAAGTASGYNVAAAITTALASLRSGDIIVIEQQMIGPTTGTNDYVPVEWFQPAYDAIKMAVANEVIVCEAAGNGNQDLDGSIFNAGHKPFLPENDSGAIIVGAGAASGATNRSRLDFSSYGSAVDLQGWGESVVTTGYGDLFKDDGTNFFYTKIFNGTSSATPVVAGACAAVQGAYRSAHGGGQVIGALEMRSLLQTASSPQTGANAATQNIGPLPNLAAAIPLALVDRRIWVDFAYTGTPEDGTPRYPVKTLSLAITAVSTNGAIIIKGGSTPWNGTITKPFSLHAYLGNVTIGQ